LGNYFASPVAVDDKVYLLSEEGKAVVVQAGLDWKQLSVSDLREPCMATPALVDGQVFVRTANSLYCFGAAQGGTAR
jgi:outer membrane protein assembly factor BamB